MEAVQVTEEEQRVLDAMRANLKLKGAIVVLVEVAQSGELSTESAGALDKAAASLPAPGTAPTVSIEQMKNELRAADCLYDNASIWKQLGAKDVPAIPDSVIQEAYEKGGRVVLKCSSISTKAEALQRAGRNVYFGGTAEQRHYTENVSKPEWIVVQSHIDGETLGSPKRDVVTFDKPAPTPEDWFAAIAYAKLEDGRQPKGCENKWAFTTESRTVVGSVDDFIYVGRFVVYARSGFNPLGAARFGRPRN